MTENPTGAEVWQTAGGFDGYGEEIVETRIDDGFGPNWFRPSYRVRPVRIPMNVRLVSNRDAVDEGSPVVVSTMI